MDIVTTAILGTGQQSQPALTTETPVDGLVASLPDGEIERKLLLTAGMLAIYQHAGTTTRPIELALEPAATETLLACSPNAAHYIQQTFRNQDNNLLLEAFSQLQQARLRLPFTMLPEALNYGKQHKEVRSTLIPVLGERGRWLSQFHEVWSWLTQFLIEQSASLPDNAEAIWQEGTVGQRSEILSRLRAVDADLAREWLAAVWKKEKSEVKQSLLNTFKVALSSADEAFLEQALNDRSGDVRQMAIALLARLPGSALSQRMLARADAVLAYHKKRVKSELFVTLPQDIPQEWRRDGITANLKDTPLIVVKQILTYIPPEHWEERFSTPVTELLAAGRKSDPQASALFESWTEAALLFESQNWFEPLFDSWKARLGKTTSFSSTEERKNVIQLLQHLPANIAGQKVLTFFKALPESWYELPLQLLEALPIPWSEEFGLATLDALRDFITSPDKTHYYKQYTWKKFTEYARVALPESCFAAACRDWKLSEEAATNWQEPINSLIETIQNRKKFIEEIR